MAFKLDVGSLLVNPKYSLDQRCICLSNSAGIEFRVEDCDLNCARAIEYRRRAIIEELKPKGCVCPVGAEATCQGAECPRK